MLILIYLSRMLSLLWVVTIAACMGSRLEWLEIVEVCTRLTDLSVCFVLSLVFSQYVQIRVSR